MNKRDDNLLLEIRAPSAFYQKDVILTKHQWQNHIQPFKSGVTPGSIKAVISGHDAIYQDKSVPDRHMIINSTVATTSGKPLTVVVDVHEGDRENEVVTAFYNRKPHHGPLIWQSDRKSLFRSSYDEEHDVLQVAKAEFKSSEDEEVEDGLFFGFEEGGTEPGSAMIFNFRKRTEVERQRLITQISTALHVAKADLAETFG